MDQQRRQSGKATRWMVVAGLLSLTALVPLGVLIASESPAPAATYQADLSRSGYTTDTTITTSSVSHLWPQWVISGGSTINAQPVVDNGTVYWGDWNGYEHATTTSGKAEWSTNLGNTPSPPLCPFTLPTVGVVSTPTTGSINGQNIVWVGGGTGQMVALNAQTGAILWQTQLGGQYSVVWSPPLLYNNSIYVGSSSETWPDVPGVLYKLDAATGTIQATFNLVPPGCNGATVWTAPSANPAENAIFVTTGDDFCNGPYQDAFLKLDATTLKVLSEWQIPQSQRISNGDIGASPMLFNAAIGGQTRNLVGAESKNGTYYVVDQDNLSAGPLWQVQVAPTTNLTKCNPLSSSAWAGGTNPVMVAGTSYNGSTCVGTLFALDPATGQTQWQTSLPGIVLGSVTEAPGLVAVGSGASLLVLSASDGSVLFSYTDPSSKKFYAPPTFQGNTLYAANSDGNLYAFSPATTPPTTGLLIPANNAYLKGASYLDGIASDPAGITKVEFHLTGGSLNDSVVGTGTPTWVGWLSAWDTTTVPEGVYSLQSVAYDGAGNVGRSLAVTVNVGLPATAVVAPSSSSGPLYGGQWFDASASANSNITKVEFHLTGGSLNDAVIATGTATYYGWLTGWNTTTVADGSYALQSVAYDAAGHVARSQPVSVKISNIPVTSVLIPSNGASLSGDQYLDAGASAVPGVSKVEFHLTGGSLNDAVIATGTATYYGWLTGWNTTTVANGTYSLRSVAYDPNGHVGRSLALTITINN